ncbi:MAG: D-aminoacyl-tRNA deacylase [Alistipes sp.]|nr:D-aminoacyl-tRNA deacylase [Alistipes sp.]
MRILTQRVQHASVSIQGTLHGAIGHGLLVFVGIEEADTSEDVAWLTGKLIKLRIFADDQGVMNRSVEQVGGEILIVSQFTLHAMTRRGNRPSYIRAARPEHAIPLYEAFVASVEQALGRHVPTGVFGADMQVELLNDGPVTLWIDSQNRE